MTKTQQPNHLTVSEVTPSEWPAICMKFSDLSFEQSLTYSQAAASRVGATARYLALNDAKGQLVAAVGLRIKTIPVLGKGIAWAPAGPLLHRLNAPPVDAEMTHAVLTALKHYFDTCGHVLRLRFPVVAPHMFEATDQGASDLGYVATNRAHSYRSVIIDCTASEEDLMRNLHGKWRNLLRKAMKSDIELEISPLTDVHARFDKMYHEVQSAKGFQPDIPPSFYYDLTGPDFRHDVLIAQENGEDIAGMTIGMTGQNAVYLFGATTQRGRSLNAGYFQMWQAILFCKREGIRWFDLGGIDTTSNPEVTRFKFRTGGLEVTAPGPYEYRPRKPATALILLVEQAYAKLKGKR